MNRHEHIIGGSIFSGGTFLIHNKIRQRNSSLASFLFAMAGGAIAGILPDILEPANSSHHRGPFHSITIAALIGYVAYNILKNPNFSDDVKNAIIAFCVGYDSHIMLDSFTPRGVPLFK